MTTFEDVLTVEQEVEQAASAAKEEVALDKSAALTERDARLAAEEIKLKETADASLDAHSDKIDEMTKKIESEVDSKIIAVKKQFASKKDELKSLIKKSF